MLSLDDYLGLGGPIILFVSFILDYRKSIARDWIHWVGIGITMGQYLSVSGYRLIYSYFF